MIVPVRAEPRVPAVGLLRQTRLEDHLVRDHQIGADRTGEVRLPLTGLDVLDLEPLEQVLVRSDRIREPERERPVAGDLVLARLQELNEAESASATTATATAACYEGYERE